MSNSQDLFNTPSEINQTDAQSGLRSSDIDVDYSNLSLSGVSQTEPSSATTLRPGVNDDYGTAAGERSGGITDLPQNVIYGTDINIGQIMDQFKNFVLQFKTDVLDENFVTDIRFEPNEPFYQQKLKDMILLGRCWVSINCQHLEAFNSALYQRLVVYPKEVIPAMDSVINSVTRRLIEQMYSQSRPNLRQPIQTRPFNCGQTRSLRMLGPDDLDQLVTVSGLVIRLSSVIPEMTQALFQCSKCSMSAKVGCERGRIIEPEVCGGCLAKHTMSLIHNLSEFTDKQMIKLQESPDDMPAGETPHTVTMYCYQDLVDKIQPGDRVTVTGIYRAVPQRENIRQRVIKAVFNTYLDVLHFQKCANRLRDDEDKTSLTPERIEQIKQLSLKPDLYERLSSTIAPNVYGNETIKKGILLMLFGGSEKPGTRENIHILLCGDPATSKSQLLQYVYNLTPRSQYTSGKGSSEVGLTAYVTRDMETRNPTLQSGALALADNGVCCIDEFDKMSDTTRSVLHEVMEQQTISIAKAGIICQLNARTSVLAAANPVGSNWDQKKTIIENIQLPPTLLSRFDLIFLMLDPQDEVYDARLARHIIGLFVDTRLEDGSTEADGSVDYELLRDYIGYARDNIRPALSEEAENYLVDEYVEMRRTGRDKKGQISAYPRQVESLIRLAEAHAKMRLSHVATIEDCVEARRLQREALKQAAIDPVTGLIDINILTTGVSGGIRKRKEEMALAIYNVLEERRVLTFTYERVLSELRAQSDRMITREMFEDGLNFLKMDNKIDWSGKTIRKR